MSTTHFSGPVDSVGGFSVNGTSVVSSAGTVTSAASIVVGSTTISEAEIGVLDGVVAGTVVAGQAVVPTTSKVVDALTITTGTVTTLTSTTANLTNLKYGATPVAQVDPASCTITAAAGAANHSTITVTLKDGSGATIARVHPFKVYLATDSSGLTLQSAASTGYSVSSGGVKDPTGSTTITQGIAALCSASGACVLDLLDTGKGTGNLILVLPNGIKASASITSGSYG